jgi:hypothetical protein
MISTDTEGELDSEQTSIKDFNFPKMHGHSHVFDHILDKGITSNYSTKLFERLHGPLKTWYRFKTNFKNTAPQVCNLCLYLIKLCLHLALFVFFWKILQADHHMLTSIFIRGQIDTLYNQDHDEDTDLNDSDHASVQISANVVGLFGNVSLGSAQPSCTFRELEQSHLQDRAFTRFRLRFRDFLDILLRQNDSPIEIHHNHSLSIDAEQLVGNFWLIALFM